MVAAAALSANGLDARRGHVFGRELVLAAQGADTDVSSSGVGRRRALGRPSARQGVAAGATDFTWRHYPPTTRSDLQAFSLLLRAARLPALK